MNFAGFDTSMILILRGRILMPMGGFPEMLSQRISGVSVGRLGVDAEISGEPAAKGKRNRNRGNRA